MTTPHQLKTPSGAGFSFMDLFSPKVVNLISFGDQPNQADVETEEVPRKTSGLEAYSKRNKQGLPSDFADQVLENEMDLEKDFVTLETVNKLTELYSLAMAFYESEGNHKYKYFANKLQDLLMKPNVKEMMMREMAPSKTKTEEKQVKRLRLENKISKINAEREAFTVVKSQEYRDKELNKVLERNIQSQKDRIKQRLAEKKARSASRAQSVTYISDDNSSVADENAQDLEKELEGAPKINERPLLNDIAEVDETRYNTPPRKRTKDGHMIFFEKGKAQKTFKFDFDVEDRKPMKAGHARRHSYHKEPVVTVLAQKRTSRAQSFGNSKAPFPIEALKPLANETDEKPLVDRKETKNQTIVEDCNEGENKSLNSVESAGKNQPVEEPVVHEETHNVESAVFLDEDEPSDHEEHEAEVATVEEQVIEEVQQQVANDQQEVAIQAEANAAEEQVVEQVEAKEEEQVQAETKIDQEEEEVEPVESKQEEAVEETQTEQVEAQEAEAKVEEQQVETEAQQEVEPVEVNTEEQREEVVEEAQTEQTETKEEEVQVEPKIEQQEVKQEEAVEETQIEQVEAEPKIEQQEVEATQEVVEEIKVEQVEPEVQQEVEQVQAKQEETAEETQTEQVEAQEAEPKIEQQEVAVEETQIEQVETKEETQAEVQEEVVQIEEQQIPTEVVEENKTEKVAQVQEENGASPKEKKSRTRTDSEVADEKKLELMRQIDAEQKELMNTFTKKQEEEREEVTKKIEEKYEQKIQSMKEEMDEDEIAGDMWQRALKKFTKDKETEINEAVEKLGQEQVQEYEKYKKKLLQQKMFKLAELSE